MCSVIRPRNILPGEKGVKGLELTAMKHECRTNQITPQLGMKGFCDHARGDKNASQVQWVQYRLNRRCRGSSLDTNEKISFEEAFDIRFAWD